MRNIFYGIALISVILFSIRIQELCKPNTIGIVRHSPAASEGFTFYTVNKNTYLLDNCGRIVHQWGSEYEPGHAAYLLEDGSLLRATKHPNERFDNGGLGGGVEWKDWNGNLLWEYKYSDSLLSQHHDIFPMPSGNILILALTLKSKAEAIAAGRDPSHLPDGELYNEQIIEIVPSGKNGARVVWEWNLWDHLVQDHDPGKSNFGNVRENPQRLDINYLGTSGGDANWIHINSLDYDETLDQILFCSRLMNEIYIIDHSTTTAEAASHSGGKRGKGGDFLYRWGNPEAYGRGTAQDQILFGPHYPYWIPKAYPDGGKIMIFNNGSGRDSLFSSVELIKPPVTSPGDYRLAENGRYGPEEPEYSYFDRDNRKDFFSLILANAQRLPNGNTLINEGVNGRFFEIDPEESIVWEYINPDTPECILSQGDPPPTGNNVFRAVRYPSDYQAFKGKDLSPKGYIEMDPNPDDCGCSL